MNYYKIKATTIKKILLAAILFGSSNSLASSEKDLALKKNSSLSFIGCGQPANVWSGTYKAKLSKFKNETFCVAGFDFFDKDSQFKTMRLYFNSTDKFFEKISAFVKSDVFNYKATPNSKKDKLLKKLMKKYKSMKWKTLAIDYYKYSIEKTIPVVKKLIQYKNKQVNCSYESKDFDQFGNSFCVKIREMIELDIIVENVAGEKRLKASKFLSRPSSSKNFTNEL